MSTMSEILASTRKLIEVKKAEFNSTLKKADDKALNNTGAGDDSPLTRGHALDATQSALEPTKKPLITSDAMTAQPPSDGKGTKADLKGKNEGNVTDRADKLEAGDSVLEPKKEPLITSDANANPEAGASGQTAKQATAKLANEILTDIRAYQQKRATAPQAEAKPAPKAEAKPAEKAAAMPAQLAAALAKKEGPEPAAEDKADGKKEDKKVDKKEASGPQLELTTDVLAKIASIVLSSEEGAEFVEGQLAKAAGAEAAQETLAFLAEQSEMAEKQAAFEQGQADAEALIQQAVYQAGREAGQKEAAAAQQNKLMAGLGQKVAQAGIEEMMGQGAGSMEGGAPGPDVGAAELAGGAAGGMPGAEGGAGADITEEDLMMALQALVQEGTIQPEEAQAVVEALTGGGAGGEAAGGMPGAEAAGAAPEAAPAAASPAAEEGKAGEKSEEKAEAKEEKEEKESSVQKKASALLDAIRQVRASRK